MATSASTASFSLPNNNVPKTAFPFSSSTKPFHNNNLRFPFSPFKLISDIKSSGLAKYDEAVIDEEMDKIRRLQNGSDVRGVALEGEKGRTVDLTPPAVEAISESFGEWVINGLDMEQGEAVKDVKVSLGRDPRISGASLSVAVFAGLARAGCLVFDMGLATTPACFMSTLLPPFSYDASMMMTASHLPYTRNGLKFFTKKGGLTSPEVQEICDNATRKYANRLTKVSTMLPTPPTRVDFMSTYDTPHKGFQVEARANHDSVITGRYLLYLREPLLKLGNGQQLQVNNLWPDGNAPIDVSHLLLGFGPAIAEENGHANNNQPNEDNANNPNQPNEDNVNVEEGYAMWYCGSDDKANNPNQPNEDNVNAEEGYAMWYYGSDDKANDPNQPNEDNVNDSG